MNFIFSLNKYPVLFSCNNFYFVNFGLFALLTAYSGLFTTLCFYLANDYPLNSIPWLFFIGFSIIFWSKFFYLIINFRDTLQDPITNLRSTAFYNQGGQLGAFVGVLITSWYSTLNFFTLLDIVCIGCALCLFIGRIGCYNYGCCFGKPTQSKYRVIYNNSYSKVLRVHPELKGIPLVPTQLISALFNLILFIILVILYFFVSKSGIISGIFIISSNIFRLLVHKYRANDSVTKDETLNDSEKFRVIAMIYACLGFIVLGLSILSDTPKLGFDFSLSLSIFQIIFQNKYFIFLFTIFSVVTLLLYGLHYKKLGQHF